MADRARTIQKKNWITKLQLEEIKNSAEGHLEPPNSSNEEIRVESQIEEPIALESPEPLPTAPETETDQIPEDVDREMLDLIKTNLLAIKKEEIRIPNMKQLVSRFRFKELVKQANETAKHIQTKDITETLHLTKAVILSVAWMV